MKRNLTILMMVVIAGAMASLSADPSRAQTACKPHKVNAPILQVRKDAKIPGAYVSALQKGEIACVTDAPTVGPQKFGYVVHKTIDGGAEVKVGGWASVIFMTPVQPGDNTAAATKTVPTAKSQPAPKPAGQPKAAAATPTPDVVNDALRFDQPVPYGAPPVRGKTLKELVEGKPIFPPIEGLPKNLWQKSCASCHKWDAKTLCEQGGSYLTKAAEVFRHQHPYGGPYKLALMRWAKTGCN
jgi:hypothetical protein